MVSDSSSASASRTSTSSSRGFVSPDSSSLNDVGKNVGAAYAAGLIYLSAQADRAKVAARKFVLMLLLAILGGIIAGTIVISATALLVVGVAEAIGSLLGNRPWAGDLITGAGIVVIVLLAGYLIISRMGKAARLRTLGSYEKQQF